jgi:HTH-type transcriptional regulator/antitoxin HigA
MKNNQCYIIEKEAEYKKALERFDEIIDAPKGSDAFKEKQLLALLINNYEQDKWEAGSGSY